MCRRVAKLAIPAGIMLLIIPLLTACGAGITPGPPTPISDPKVSYDFRNGVQDWKAGFADYPPGAEQPYQLESGIRDLPAGAEPKGTGFYIAGNNHSDDLFMFLKRKLGAAEGVQENTTYRLTFQIVLASSAPSGCTGIGGAPGEGVTVKAGGSATEPQPEVKDGMYRLNVDKGQQDTGGPAGEVVGNVANNISCDQAAASNDRYVSLTQEHRGEFAVTSSASGELWLLIGSDSGFEGRTALYYQRIEVQLVAIR